VNLKKRIVYRHIPELTVGDHSNKPFQNSATKHGVGNFVWFLLEACPREKTVEREQFYLDKYRPFCGEKRGFNIGKKADAASFGRSPSEETRMKLSIALKGRLISEGTKRKLSVANIGKRYTKEAKRKLALARLHLKKGYTFISPEGEKVSVFGLNEFCREKGLSGSTMAQVAKGNRHQHKGWRRA
jgi:group I intron endonuclease